MSTSNKHLKIGRELRTNPRRKNGRMPPPVRRDDLVGHSQRLTRCFDSMTNKLKSQNNSDHNEQVIKIKYEGTINLHTLQDQGIKFISQEDDFVHIGFSNKENLNKFYENIKKLGYSEMDSKGLSSLLQAICDIDIWGREDRKSWSLRHKGFPLEKIFLLDIEVWPLEEVNHPIRRKLINSFEEWINNRKITIKDKLNIDSLIMYRVEVTHAQAELLLEHSDVRMLDLPPISGIPYHKINKDINFIQPDIPSPSENAPKVCILDSGISTNHPLLKPAIAESASFVRDDEVSDVFGHGTQVAGIALYGNIEECCDSNYWVPRSWIYNGKILKDNGEFDVDTIESTIIKAVEYFVSMGCKIFNLSIGNENRPYNRRHIDGLAYVLDVLSRKHDIVFVVSAGNFRGCDDIPRESWKEEYPNYLIGDHNYIIDPAPALNVLTVGSLALHDATRANLMRPNDIEDLSAARKNQPSPFTRHGPSINGAIKPELVAYGGNFACPMRFDGKQWQAVENEPGIMTLNNNFIGGTLFNICHGTSFSAPYITHLASRVLEQYPRASANMIRAMLLNQASIPSECTTTFNKDDEVCINYIRDNPNRGLYTDIVGYGAVNEDNLYSSDQTAVLLMAEEEIENDKSQFFELPLPDSFLRGKLSSRTITVSLAYSPAVKKTRLDYKATKISYCLVRGESLEEVQKHFNQNFKKNASSMNDSVNDKKRSHSNLLRSKGTAQSSSWSFKKLSPKVKWYVVVTRQDASGWGDVVSKEKEKYSLVVSVTDKENEEAMLYTEISQLIEQKVQTRIRNIAG